MNQNLKNKIQDLQRPDVPDVGRRTNAAGLHMF